MSYHLLQQFFSADYAGYTAFAEKVLHPIFGARFQESDDFKDLRAYPHLAAEFDLVRTSGDEQVLRLAQESGITAIYDLGILRLGTPIHVYDITVCEQCRLSSNRKTIQKLIRRVLTNRSAAIMVFHYAAPGKEWRLSYCQIDSSHRDATNAKRFTYLLGREQSCKTPALQLAKLYDKRRELKPEDLKNAFSVETVSRKFFDSYREMYADIVCHVTGKRMVKRKSKWEEEQIHEPNEELMAQFSAFPNPEKAVRDYVKKLMGRLVFLCFIQKKGWLGVPQDDETWTCGDKEFLKHLALRYGDGENFIDDVLEPLFNDLNTKRANDTANPVLGSGIKIPYLNGGLFERDAEDDTRFPLPISFFWNEDDEKPGLLNFFESYNFTIDENSPDDAEVGVDPEMLGRVFENLLEDNKDKGAFYTPKEMVQYMCRESLIAYLQHHLGKGKENAVRNFVTEQETQELSASDREQLLTLLRDVKICDPAIGSGAFPMGMLRELFECRVSLEGVEDAASRTKIKKEIIQNAIYGVDIEKGAVDIARLRFWLALVIDEATPHALPNMDFKIMQGNSLLEEYRGIKLNGMTMSQQAEHEARQRQNEWQGYLAFNEGEDILTQIQQNISAYYGEDSHEEKIALRGRINQDIRQYLKLISPGIAQEVDTMPIPNEHFFLWHLYFKDVFTQGGFDIVIGNPPYFVYNGEAHKASVKVFKTIPEYEIAMGGKMNAYKVFLAHALKCLVKKESGITCFIFQNSFLGDKAATALRRYTLSRCQILGIDSFPERDNVRKRVFESVKMSVCIVLIQKKSAGHSFGVRFWEDKDKTKGISTSFTEEELRAIDPETLTIPRVAEELKPIIIKMIGKRHEKIQCNEGELNMTTCRQYFSETSEGPLVMKGAGIQRFYHTLTLSQGQIEHLDERRYLAECGSSPKAHHHEMRRIAMQGMTGANDKIRLIMTIVPQGMYLANSCNYIMPHHTLSAECLLGILNSKAANLFIRCFSTNSNVNNYEAENIPVPKLSDRQQQEIHAITDQLLRTKAGNPHADTSKEEEQLNTLVYDAFDFSEEERAIIERYS